MSCCILGGVVLQWPIGRLSDIADRRSVLLGLSVATVVSATGLALFTSSEWSFYLQVFILGGLLFTLYPLSITQVCDRLDIQDITKATGVLLLAYGAGAIIGPIAAPPFTQLFPVYGLPGFIAAVATFLSIIGAFMIWRQEGVPMEDQQDFVPLPVTTTPIGYDLDPRAPEIDEETEESATQQ
jgi:MFS family permease